MLTKERLLNLLDRIRESVERGGEFGVLRYEAHEERYIVQAQAKGFDEENPDEEVRISALLMVNKKIDAP